VVWALGFRPFFLLLPPWLCLVLVAWVAALSGLPGLVPADPLGWHAHEMVIGFAGGLLSGFLLTAARSWTGRPTAHGCALQALVACWIFGRIAAWTSTPVFGAAVDVALLVGVAVAIARPIVAVKRWRNAGFPLLLLGLAAADVAIHAGGRWLLSGRAVSVVIVGWFLLSFGGRITPLFTRNALPEAGVRARSRVDDLGVWSMAPVVLLEALAPQWSALRPVLGGALLLAGLANLARMWGWRTPATVRSVLLWTLHLGFACVGAALTWRGAALLTGASALPATHLLTVGGLGTLSLCMMSRVVLGHTGRALVPPPLIRAALVIVPLAALLRVVGGLLGGTSGLTLLRGGGLLLVLAFGLYGLVTGPWLLAPRVDGKPG